MWEKVQTLENSDNSRGCFKSLQTEGPVRSLRKYDGDSNENRKINRFELAKQQLSRPSTRSFFVLFCFVFFFDTGQLGKVRLKMNKIVKCESDTS